MIRIGLISDTHGLLRPEAVDVLRGSDFIVHAGDIGEGVLEPLSTIAPVTAVRGNNDRAPWAERIAETEWLRFGEVTLHVLHDLADLGDRPERGRRRRGRHGPLAPPEDRAPQRRALRQPGQRRPGALQACRSRWR